MSSARSSVRAVCLASTVVLLLCPGTASPQILPAELDIPAIRDVAEVTCDFRYPDRAPADVIQGGEPELRVTVRSEIGKPSYALSGVSQRRDPGDSNPEFVRLVGAPIAVEVPDEYRYVRRFDFKVRIDDDAPPQPYDVVLRFEAPQAPPVTRPIRLFVGARASSQYVDASAGTVAPLISAGDQSTFSLRVVNKFPSYDLMLRRVKVTSDPAGLIEDVDLELKQRIGRGDPTGIPLTVTARQSLLRQLSVFEIKPRLNVLLWYDDGYRSEIERIPEIPIEFNLGFGPSRTAAVAFVSVLLGAILGAWVRIRFTKASTVEKRRSMYDRIAASVVLGGMFVLFVMVAKVEVSAVEGMVRVPLHKPVVTLLIAFVVGLYDPADLVDYARRKAGLARPPVGGQGK